MRFSNLLLASLSTLATLVAIVFAPTMATATERISSELVTVSATDVKTSTTSIVGASRDDLVLIGANVCNSRSSRGDRPAGGSILHTNWMETTRAIGGGLSIT